MSTTTDLTIATWIDKVGVGLPATELVRELLKYLKTYSAFGRDAQLLGQVLFKSTVAYNAIQDCMKAVQTAPTLDWDNFDRYTGAIPPLEEILLTFYLKTADGPRNHLPPVDTVAGGVTAIQIWVTDRIMIHKALGDLAGSGQIQSLAKAELAASYETARMHDDKTTQDALFAYFLNVNKLQDINSRNKRSVAQAQKTIVAMSTKVKSRPPPNREASEMLIRSLMLVYIPFAYLWNISKPENPTKDFDKTTRDHLKKEEVWTALMQLLTALSTFLDNKQSNLDEVELKWTALRDLLMLLTPSLIETLPEMLELIRLSTQVRSPFRERVACLVRILRHLDEESAKNNADTEDRQALKEVMQTSIKAVKTTNTVATDVRSCAVGSEQYKGQDTALKTLLDEVEKCATENLNLQNSWPAQAAKFTAGVAMDEDHNKRALVRIAGTE